MTNVAANREQFELQAMAAQLSSFANDRKLSLLSGQLGQQAGENPLANSQGLFNNPFSSSAGWFPQPSIYNQEIRPGRVIMFTPPGRGKKMTMTKTRVKSLEVKVDKLAKQATGETKPSLKNQTVTAVRLTKALEYYLIPPKSLSWQVMPRDAKETVLTTQVPLAEVVSLLLKELGLRVASIDTGYSDGTSVELIDVKDE